MLNMLYIHTYLHLLCGRYLADLVKKTTKVSKKDEKRALDYLHDIEQVRMLLGHLIYAATFNSHLYIYIHINMYTYLYSYTYTHTMYRWT